MLHMKYFVIEDDELSSCGEETIYVFEHSKGKSSYDTIKTLEDFAATCQFIERRNTHWFWYKGKHVEDMPIWEFEKKFRAEQEELKTISQEEFTELRNRYAPLIKPIEFPIEGIRIAYAYEPEWNDEFFVMETEESYFSVYWFTTA